MKTLILVMTVFTSLTGHTQEPGQRYRCISRCFALNFDQGSALSLGQVTATATDEGEAFLMASERCESRAIKTGTRRQDAFLVTRLRERGQSERTVVVIGGRSFQLIWGTSYSSSLSHDLDAEFATPETVCMPYVAGPASPPPYYEGDQDPRG